MRILRTALPVIAALTLVACGNEATPPDSGKMPHADPAPDLTSQLTGDFRSEEDRDRDAGRRPAEVIEFLGIEPGMQVLDLMAAGGWYTEVLSIAVGPDGHVVSQNTEFGLQMREGANEKALSARLADGRMPNVSRLNKETIELSADDGPFDAGLTALNLHDLYNRGGDEFTIAILSAVYTTLKPGGIFGLIDHEGIAGNDNAELHRMVKADAIRVAEAAGFAVEADSDILQSDIDDMTQHMRSDGVRGKTNRFLLRLRKPE